MLYIKGIYEGLVSKDEQIGVCMSEGVNRVHVGEWGDSEYRLIDVDKNLRV